MGLSSQQEYINWLQRYIIVHSYIYYHCDTNVISDKDYDKKAKELVALKGFFPDEWQHSEYRDQFGDDYNGATGFDLYDRLNDHQREIIRSIAGSILTRR